jgi:hypothetical protein
MPEGTSHEDERRVIVGNQTTSGQSYPDPEEAKIKGHTDTIRTLGRIKSYREIIQPGKPVLKRRFEEYNLIFPKI